MLLCVVNRWRRGATSFLASSLVRVFPFVSRSPFFMQWGQEAVHPKAATSSTFSSNDLRLQQLFFPQNGNQDPAWQVSILSRGRSDISSSVRLCDASSSFDRSFPDFVQTADEPFFGMGAAACSLQRALFQKDWSFPCTIVFYVYGPHRHP